MVLLLALLTAVTTAAATADGPGIAEHSPMRHTPMRHKDTVTLEHERADNQVEAADLRPTLSKEDSVVAAAHVELTVSMSEGKPFEHRWKRSFGSGHASLTLRKDWRAQLLQASSELGVQAVRYHGLFDDDMGPVVTLADGADSYNFSLVESTWDFLLSAGVRPLVELSFMPAFLANCTWHGHCPKLPPNCTGYGCTVCGGHGAGPVVNPHAPARCVGLEFHYQGIRQPPYKDDYTRWHELVHALVAHAVGRYGLAEVQTWDFEVWNELWGMPFPHEYMALYEASASAVKRVHPSLRVGGPATAGLALLADFESEARSRSAPVDFVSTHSYPSDACPKGDAWDPACFARRVSAARQRVRAKRFYLTEYNVGCCLGYSQHDTSAAAAFVFRAVAELNDVLDIYSYWTFSDVFEEGGLPQLEFRNVYGSMTIGGVPKPVWRAFQLLHEHAGETRLDVVMGQETMAANLAHRQHEQAALSSISVGDRGLGVDRPSSTSVHRHESAPPLKQLLSAFATAKASEGLRGARVFVGFWGNPDSSVPPAPSRVLRLTLIHAEKQPPLMATVYLIDQAHGSAVHRWELQGRPARPSAEQYEELLAASRPTVVQVECTPTNKTALSLVLELQQDSAAVISFEKAQWAAA